MQEVTPIKFCASAIMVRDMKKARQFYEGLLRQTVELDHGQCVSFPGGFGLWEVDHASGVIFGKEDAIAYCRKHHSGELYFEADDLDGVFSQIYRSGAEFIHGLREQPWGQRVFRIYDPDGHIVEIGEPMPAVIRRFLKQMTPEDVAIRTSMPLGIVKSIAESDKS